MDESSRRAVLADLYTLPGHLLWRSSARVLNGLDRILPGGTDISAYAVLLALADEEPQSQRSLADVVGVSGTTMTSIAQALQSQALAERVRNPADRRSYLLTRTPSGRSAVRRWRPHLEGLEAHLTAGLTPAEATRLRELLAGLIGDQLHDRTPRGLLDSTAFLLTRAHQTTHRELQTLLRPLAIEPRHFGCLRALRVAGPLTQNELGGLLDVSPATVVVMVDDLEARGLVVRRPDPADRRVHRLEPTPDAAAVAERAEALSWTALEGRLGPPDGRDSPRSGPAAVPAALLCRRGLSRFAAIRPAR